MKYQLFSPALALILNLGLVSSAVPEHAGDRAATSDAASPVASRSLCGRAQRISYDDGEDVEDLRQKSDQGDLEAMNRLGIIYARGRGVDKNYGRALIWFRRAALQGYPPAMANLGTMYQLGAGVRRDYRQAYAWLRVALALGVPEEDHDATIFKLGMIASQMGRNKVVRAERLADVMVDRITKQCGLSVAR
jgi:TPR repeat protein